MAAIVDLIKALAWPAVVAGALWHFREEIKAALKSITGIKFNELKFGPPPEQQIASSPSTVTVQELPSPTPKLDVPTPTTDVQTFIEKVRSFISADQLDPVLQSVRTDLARLANTSAYRFDQWIGFLINAGLLVQSGGTYVLTNFGRGFLKYVVDKRLSVNKAF